MRDHSLKHDFGVRIHFVSLIEKPKLVEIEISSDANKKEKKNEQSSWTKANRNRTANEMAKIDAPQNEFGLDCKRKLIGIWQEKRRKKTACDSKKKRKTRRKKKEKVIPGGKRFDDDFHLRTRIRSNHFR